MPTTTRTMRRTFDCLNDSGIWADVAHHIHDEYGSNMLLVSTDDPRIIEANTTDGSSFRVASTGGRAFRLCDVRDCSEAMTTYVSGRQFDAGDGYRYFADYVCAEHAEMVAR